MRQATNYQPIFNFFLICWWIEARKFCKVFYSDFSFIIWHPLCPPIPPLCIHLQELFYHNTFNYSWYCRILSDYSVSCMLSVINQHYCYENHLVLCVQLQTLIWKCCQSLFKSGCKQILKKTKSGKKNSFLPDSSCWNKTVRGLISL